jgi:hypothetical protein
MQALRGVMRFLFGLQALALLVVIPAFLWLPRLIRNVERDGIAQFATLVLATCILNLVPAIAWWRLRQRKSDARWWAVAASVLCLPLPTSGILGRALLIGHSWIVFARILHIPHQLLELAVGITGVAVFLPSRPIQPAAAEPKLERIEGDGTSTFWKYAFQALVTAGTIVAFVWWPRWGTSQGLEIPSLGPGIAIFLLATFIEICGHELGHVIAGSLCGRRLRMFHVGPFRWSVRNGAWKFEFSPKLTFSGSVILVPLTLENFRRRKAIELVGGPLASLTLCLTGVVALLTSIQTSWRPFWFLFAMISTVSAISFLANLIPQRTKLFYSDGAQLYQILSNGPWGKVHLALGMSATSLLSDIRPRDWDIGLINEAASFLRTGVQGMVLRMIAGYYYLECRNIPEAVASTNAAADLFSPQGMRNPADFYTSFIFANALYARDLPVAEAWWLKLQALDKIDFDADYWKARSSILWLSGDLEGARQAWEHGNEKAQKLPSCGFYHFIRWQFAELRNALDQGVPDRLTGHPATESPVTVA